MQIIPVLDIKAGEVVRAWRGRRDQYQPLHCALCAGSEPERVLRSLLDLHPFRTVYVADIDAITGHGDNVERVSQLAVGHPGIDFWLDAGWDATAPQWANRAANVTVVVGSESLPGIDALTAFSNPHAGDIVLSLDYDRRGLRGPAELEVRRDLWPRRMILMELDRIGAGTGPGRERLERRHRQYPEHEWYAAGGVRDLDDLHALAASGAAGALIASILHDGRLARNDIADLETRS